MENDFKSLPAVEGWDYIGDIRSPWLRLRLCRRAILTAGLAWARY